ncbi:MAG: serine hydrolase domain-containing protein [Ilumatobacteraceae bacterium]
MTTVALTTARRTCGCMLAATLALGACADDAPADQDPVASGSAPESVLSTTAPATTVLATTVPDTTVPDTTVPDTTVPTTAPTTAPDTTVPAPFPAGADGAPAIYDATRAAFGALTGGDVAVSLSVWRDGVPVLQLAHGEARSGAPLTTGSPMVIASVSKLVTALTIARLGEAGLVDVGAPVPWVDLGFEPHLSWHDVTVRELLDHTSGMPIARQRWLDDPGPCSIPLGEVMTGPPTGDRGRWVYSNGNYCALGLLVDAVTGDRYDVAARRFVFAPVGVDGPRLTLDGAAPSDGPYGRGVARFDRLGGAGSWLAGTDHVAAVLDGVTDRDLETLRWPGIFRDQYGWGHTGSVAGATACAWTLEQGRTAVAATVAGGRPSTGGAVCDAILPALSSDLGLGDLGRPDRSPP